MRGYLIDTIATLKNIDSSNRFNGLALIVQAKKAWYLYDIASTEIDDDNNIVKPTDSNGRWYKCNNYNNIYNTTVDTIISSATTTLNFANSEQLHCIFNTNSTLNFSTTLRNGYGVLILDRNGGAWNITGWDARAQFQISSYNFSSGTTLAILNLVFFNNKIYVTEITEF